MYQQNNYKYILIDVGSVHPENVYLNNRKEKKNLFLSHTRYLVFLCGIGGNVLLWYFVKTIMRENTRVKIYSLYDKTNFT